MPGPSVSNTASSLRWRARLTKDAMATPNDDSNVLLLSTSASSDSLFEKTPRRPGRHNPRVQQVVFAACGLCIVSSLYSLCVTRTWFLALSAALSVFHAVLLVRQRLQLRQASDIYADYATQKQRVQSLRVQNERYYRQVSQLEEKALQLEQLERQLRQLALGNSKATSDTKRITTTILAFSKMQQQLQALLTTQIQSAILKALALVHHPVEASHLNAPLTPQQQQPPKYRLAAPQIDSLHRRLQAIPGVTSVQKEYFMDLVLWKPSLSGSAVDTDAATATSESEASAYPSRYADSPAHVARERTSLVPQLLQQVHTDATLQSLASTKTRLAFGTTPRGTHSFWTPYRKDHDGVSQPPVVVFGMSVEPMVAPAAEASQPQGNNGVASEMDEPHDVNGTTVLKSPMGSLHSC